MVKSRSLPIKGRSPSAKNDGDGKDIGNFLPLDAARQEREWLSPSLAIEASSGVARGKRGHQNVYFLNNGLGSVLTVLPDGKSVEVGLIGKEGFIGLPVVFGFKTSPLRIMIQSDAYRVDVQSLRKILPDCLIVPHRKTASAFYDDLGHAIYRTCCQPPLARCRREISKMAANEP